MGWGAFQFSFSDRVFWVSDRYWLGYGAVKTLDLFNAIVVLNEHLQMI